MVLFFISILSLLSSSLLISVFVVLPLFFFAPVSHSLWIYVSECFFSVYIIIFFSSSQLLLVFSCFSISFRHSFALGSLMSFLFSILHVSSALIIVIIRFLLLLPVCVTHLLRVYAQGVLMSFSLVRILYFLQL